MTPSVKNDSSVLVPPQHVAIIMDGNGRWAKKRAMPRTYGHKHGAETVRRVVEEAADIGIKYLTLFGFSSENWSRPEEEVSELMRLMRHYIRGNLADLDKNGVRLRIIGDRSRLDPDILETIENAEKTTAKNDRLHLTIAFSYGARQELVCAVQDIARHVKEGTLSPEEITENTIGNHLMTAGIPDPDLLIRTSGEQRISNFLLWQVAYAEFLFVDTLWPDFSRADLDYAVAEYNRRDRRFGGLKSA